MDKDNQQKLTKIFLLVLITIMEKMKDKKINHLINLVVEMTF